MKLILIIVCFISYGRTGEVSFGEVNTLMKFGNIYPSWKPTNILSVEPSISEPNTFFISINSSILLARLDPGSQIQPEVIAGNITAVGYKEGEGTEAMFRGAVGIVEVDNGLIVSDSKNYCLRLIQPPSAQSTKWKTSTYAGRCLVWGSTDARRQYARFDYLIGLTKHENLLFIADYGNGKLRQLEMDSGAVTTLYSSEVFLPVDMVLNETGNEIYVVVQHGILKIGQGKESWLVGWGNKTVQTKKAPFSTAGFGTPQSITWLSEDILLVTDHSTRTVKVVDLTKQEVNVICPVQAKRIVDGNIRQCSFRNPLPISVMNNTILVGDATSVRSLNYRIIEDKLTTEAPILPGMCNDPPSVPNSIYKPMENYPEGTTVDYQCTGSYVPTEEHNNARLACTHVTGKLRWIGEQLECRPLSQMVTASVLAAICICTVIAIVVTAVKTRSINKQLEEATGRQTQVTMTTTKFARAGTRGGCSNRSFASSEGGDGYSRYVGPDPHISTSPAAKATQPTKKQVPQIVPRRTKQTNSP